MILLNILLTDENWYSFLEKVDFWIFLIIGGLGLIYSISSFIQAKDAKIEATLAKLAAVEAGKLVQILNVSNEVTEILGLCQISFTEDNTYIKASNKINALSGRISKVITLIESETKANPSQKEVVDQIKSTLSQLRTSLNSFNTFTNTEGKTNESLIYMALEPNVGSLYVQINSLAAYLQNTLSVPKK